MRNRLLFVALAFTAYWLLVNERGLNPVALDPVKPALVPVLSPAYDLEEPKVSEAAPLLVHDHALITWLKSEASLIGRPDPRPQDTLFRLQDKARELTALELTTLKRVAMNRYVDADERFLAVYMLGLAGGEGLDLLRELSLARVPGLPNDRQHSDEIILRTQAIETLVQKLPREEARHLLEELLNRTSDPILARHVQYWLNRLS